MRFTQADPCLRCRQNGLACLMPRFKQVNRRYRPTCFECISVQNPRDSFICSFADLKRYPALQEWPAKVPRLIAAPLPTTTLRPNNRVRASDRRVPAESLRIILPHLKSAASTPLPSYSKPSPPTSPNNTIMVDNRRYSNPTIQGSREVSAVKRRTRASIPPPPKRQRNQAKTISEKGKGKMRARSPIPSPVVEFPPSAETEISPELVDGTLSILRPERQGNPVETSSRKGKEKERAHTPPPYPEFEFAPSLLNEDDIGTQVGLIETIAPPIPQREIGIGEAGPSTIHRSTSSPLFFFGPYSGSPSPPLTGDNVSFDPARVIPSSVSCSPMTRYIPPSPSNDDEDEELVFQMLLDD